MVGPQKPRTQGENDGSNETREVARGQPVRSADRNLPSTSHDVESAVQISRGDVEILKKWCELVNLPQQHSSDDDSCSSTTDSESSEVDTSEKVSQWLESNHNFNLPTLTLEEDDQEEELARKMRKETALLLRKEINPAETQPPSAPSMPQDSSLRGPLAMRPSVLEFMKKISKGKADLTQEEMEELWPADEQVYLHPVPPTPAAIEEVKVAKKSKSRSKSSKGSKSGKFKKLAANKKGKGKNLGKKQKNKSSKSVADSERSKGRKKSQGKKKRKSKSSKRSKSTASSKSKKRKRSKKGSKKSKKSRKGSRKSSRKSRKGRKSRGSKRSKTSSEYEKNKRKTVKKGKSSKGSQSSKKKGKTKKGARAKKDPTMQKSLVESNRRQTLFADTLHKTSKKGSDVVRAMSKTLRKPEKFKCDIPAAIHLYYGERADFLTEGEIEEIRSKLNRQIEDKEREKRIPQIRAIHKQVMRLVGFCLKALKKLINLPKRRQRSKVLIS